MTIKMCLSTAAQLENDGLAPAGFMRSVLRDERPILNGQQVIQDDSIPEGKQEAIGSQ